MKKFLAASLFLGLVGCTSTPSPEVMADPKPTNTDQKAVAAIRSVLKDPFSVREFKVGEVYRAGSSAYYPNAWNVCVSFYAKNGYGAYDKGFYRIYFKNRQVVDVMGGTSVEVKADCGQMRSVKY